MIGCRPTWIAPSTPATSVATIIRRFDSARHEVADFSAKWSRGIFDPREMDNAIASVQRVVDIPALHRDDRDALREDLARMRAFRAHMEGRR